MRIAVVGANGFIGRRVMAIGRAAGLTMLPLVRRPVADLPDALVIGDLVGEDWTRAQFSCDALVHLAAVAAEVSKMADPEAHLMANNLEGTRSALALAKTAGARRFIYVSSIKAVAEFSRQGSAIDEGVTAAPVDAYGRSKLAAEQLVNNQALAGGIPAIILRPPMVYGPGAEGNFRQLVRLVERGFPLPFSSITNRRSLVFVDNLAEAILAAAQVPAEGEPSRLYHVTDPEPCSTPALVRMIAGALGRPVREFPVPVAFLEVAGRLTGQSDKVRRLVGDLEVDGRRITEEGLWRPRFNTASGIKTTIDASGAYPRRKK